MGGWGSGRQNGRPIADEAKRIDFAWMLRQKLAAPGRLQSGNLSWSCRDRPAGFINYSCDMRDPENASMELRFTVTRQWTGERTDHVQHVPLSYSQPNFGGKRWWMHCPVTGQRVGKLYVPAGGDIFASRKAWKIGYRSQRIGDRDKPFEELFRLQRRLGCPEGWEQPIRRPKGMHHRTFTRLRKRYWQLDAECGAIMLGLLESLR